ncbi:MAG: response regulator [Limnoraphis robusta]|jgi:twitching motility two-component system response regulator PilG|uniref:Regulator n=2 Tax=Limnoraphis robusta TaxID=1118279 RepID=A0A0F5YKC8_9CYAN|nr:response regulator [Limnoraphis robusta]KKD39346.1 regulator [Limnoraphis robusta CS-951]MEA5497519.1 response regulator [Limnoraphis robusta BA-68 BA1]MEA5519240.1 response regulator [Limnoraphis robusta CCNP1315]MEA5539846.1 response regulator [Limnoraphis robusta Tam1]MEA5543623.1 response regulator [Limnoraphis robusta CCNP1324]
MSAIAHPIPTVLAVDDSLVMHGLVKQALGKDYRVLVTDNAVEALSLLYQEKVSILLLDVTMPEIDGLELCRTVRNLPQFKTLPIIMLTARDGAFEKVQGRLAGATEYLTKPFNPQTLSEVITQVLSKHL